MKIAIKKKPQSVESVSTKPISSTQLSSVYFYLCDTERVYYKYQVKTEREDL